MPGASERKSPNEKVRAHRERLRRRGLRPVQVWVPDTRTAEFRAAAHAQSLAVASSDREQEDQAFVDAIADFGEE